MASLLTPEEVKPVEEVSPQDLGHPVQLEGPKNRVTYLKNKVGCPILLH